MTEIGMILKACVSSLGHLNFGDYKFVSTNIKIGQIACFGFHAVLQVPGYNHKNLNRSTLPMLSAVSAMTIHGNPSVGQTVMIIVGAASSRDTEDKILSFDIVAAGPSHNLFKEN